MDKQRRFLYLRFLGRRWLDHQSRFGQWRRDKDDQVKQQLAKLPEKARAYFEGLQPPLRTFFEKIQQPPYAKNNFCWAEHYAICRFGACWDPDVKGKNGEAIGGLVLPKPRRSVPNDPFDDDDDDVSLPSNERLRLALLGASDTEDVDFIIDLLGSGDAKREKAFIEELEARLKPDSDPKEALSNWVRMFHALQSMGRLKLLPKPVGSPRRVVDRDKVIALVMREVYERFGLAATRSNATRGAGSAPDPRGGTVCDAVGLASRRYKIYLINDSLRGICPDKKSLTKARREYAKKPLNYSAR